MNLPLAIWMIRSFMLEVPSETLEVPGPTARAGSGRSPRSSCLLVSPGLVSTALICVIFAWNELFLALNLTVTNAATLPMFLISSVPQEGLYIAHLPRGGDRRLASGDHHRLDRAALPGPRPVNGRDQVIAQPNPAQPNPARPNPARPGASRNFAAKTAARNFGHFNISALEVSAMAGVST